MLHKCFISFKMEDEYYKKILEKILKGRVINKSLKKVIVSEKEEYIMKKFVRTISLILQ